MFKTTAATETDEALAGIQGLSLFETMDAGYTATETFFATATASKRDRVLSIIADLYQIDKDWKATKRRTRAEQLHARDERDEKKDKLIGRAIIAILGNRKNELLTGQIAARVWFAGFESYVREHRRQLARLSESESSGDATVQGTGGRPRRVRT